MKRLVLLYMLGAAACGSTPGPAAAEVAWSIRINGAPATCAAAGAVTVTVNFRRVSTGESAVFTFPCNAGGGATPYYRLVQDDYDVDVILWSEDPPGEYFHASVLAASSYAVVLSGLITVLPDVVFDVTGLVAVRATWAITEGGVPSSCEAVGGDTVTLHFVRRSVPDWYDSGSSCPAGLGQFLEAALLYPDIYDVTVTLWHMYQRPGQQSLGTFAFAVNLNGVGVVTQLPAIVFTLSAATAGQFQVAWTIVNASGPDTCAAVGADTFEWKVTHQTSGQVDIFLYNCSDMAAVTAALPLGTYNATARLLAGTQELGAASANGLVLNTSLYLVPTFTFSFN